VLFRHRFVDAECRLLGLDERPERREPHVRRGPFNIGIACGPSGLLVVDQDGPRDLEVFAADIGVVIPNTRRSRTGRGTHVLFRHDHSRQPVGNAEGRLGDYDVNIRGNGGFIVGPGLMHQDGERYAFLNPTTPICVAPEWLIKAVTASPASPRAPLAGVGGAAASQLPGGPIQQGRRHLSMLSYAGKLANTNLSLAELTPIFLKRWTDCTQPLCPLSQTSRPHGRAGWSAGRHQC